MDKALFEQLLYEGESPTLDFKMEQYRFAKASDHEKSELLKDILGFANAWRRSKAYILIGVEDIEGERGNPVGIPVGDHIDDHSLQQFVNNLTNQPVLFHYEAFGFEEKQFGIICIEQQTRPVYLKKDYGKLKKNEVYVRRGSSTDPGKPALPEEIAKMGVDSGQAAAELIVEFANIERDEVLGTSISLDTEFCEMPADEAIPNLARPRPPGPFSSLSALNVDSINRFNDDFFRELAHFEFVRRLFQPIRLVVRNTGQVAAKNVRVEIAMPTDIEAKIDIPDRPECHVNPLRNCHMPIFRRDPGDVDIIKNDERFRVGINWGDLQPGRRVWSDVFYIGKKASGDLSLSGLIFADNLPEPKDFVLTVSVTVIQTAMSVEELCSLNMVGEK